MDAWYLSGAHLAKHIQDVCDGYDNSLSWASTLAEPSKYFLWVYPIAFTFDHVLGIRVLLAASCSEWLNAIIKWVLNEHRPFWWVKLNSQYGIHLRQSPQTCETGPGCPSGHLMVSTAVLYVVIMNTTQKLKNRDAKKTLSLIVWPAYFAFTATVFTSRVFIAAHFPHQCALGVVVGVVNGYVFSRLNPERWTLRNYVAFSFVVAATSAGIFNLMSALGTDPNETINLALEACDDRNYVSISTTAFYGIMRQIACPLGLGFAVSRPDFKEVVEGAKRAPAGVKLLAGLAGVAVGQILLAAAVPPRPNVIYAATVVQYFLFSFAVGYGVPYLLSKRYARRPHHLFSKSPNIDKRKAE